MTSHINLCFWSVTWLLSVDLSYICGPLDVCIRITRSQLYNNESQLTVLDLFLLIFSHITILLFRSCGWRVNIKIDREDVSFSRSSYLVTHGTHLMAGLPIILQPGTSAHSSLMFLISSVMSLYCLKIYLYGSKFTIYYVPVYWWREFKYCSGWLIIIR